MAEVALLQKNTGEKVYCWYGYNHGSAKDKGEIVEKGRRIFIADQALKDGAINATMIEGGIHQVKKSDITGHAGAAVGSSVYITSGTLTLTSSTYTQVGVIVQITGDAVYISFKG